MISRARGYALAAVVAGAFALQAHAGGFNFGSFMLGNGGSRWVPECKAPEKLTEVKDRSGKLRWMCLAPQTAEDKSQDDKSKMAEGKAQAADGGMRVAGGAAQLTVEGQEVQISPEADTAAQVAMGMTQSANHPMQFAGGKAIAVDSKVLSADGLTQAMLSAEFEKPASAERAHLGTQGPRSTHIADYGF